MKTTLTIALTLSLFGSVAIFGDDGNQGSGTRTNDCTDPNNCPPAVCAEGCDHPRIVLPESTDSVYGEVAEISVDIATETLELVLF